MPASSRALYLSRLRRAFLLRVHPDRFRMYDSDIRVRQATLVKALSSRMGQVDFAAWQRSDLISPGYCKASYQLSTSATEKNEEYVYCVERRDGSLQSQSICLHTSVEEIIDAMQKALKRSGAAQIPAPSDLSSEGSLLARSKATDEVTSPESMAQELNPSFTSEQSSHVDYRFDKVSQRGRDLSQFLDKLKFDDVEDRKQSRTDAQAAAQATRQRYQFQSVDATSMGWSSNSVAVLLRRLLELYEEHGDKLQVTSFYPLRIVFTPDDFHNSLDIYGGVLRLNSGSTPIQWLQHLQRIDASTMEEVKRHRELLSERVKIVQSTLGVKLKKGFSCSNRDYWYFVEGLLPDAHLYSEQPNADALVVIESKDEVGSQAITVTVESSYTVRRPKVTQEGTVRVGANSDRHFLNSTIARFTDQARTRMRQTERQKETCRTLTQRLQYEWGLQRVYSLGTVSLDHYCEALARLLTTRPFNLDRLAGQQLGIAASGHFCHLSDDGSIVIPYDWS